jgi:hypothetical protein
VAFGTIIAVSDEGSGGAGPKRREIVVFQDPVTGVWRFDLEQHQIEVEPRRGYVKIDGVLHWDRRLAGLVDMSELEGRPLAVIDELLASRSPSSQLRPWTREDSPVRLSRSNVEGPRSQEAAPPPDVDPRASQTIPRGEASDPPQLSEPGAVADAGVKEQAIERHESARSGERSDLPSEPPTSEGDARRSIGEVPRGADSAYLSTPQAAGYLQLKPNTLERWRSDGGGPLFVKVGGRVFYRREDLDDFIESRRRKSTADPGTKDPS